MFLQQVSMDILQQDFHEDDAYDRHCTAFKVSSVSFSTLWNVRAAPPLNMFLGHWCKQSVSFLDFKEHLETPVCVSAARLASHAVLRHAVSLRRQAGVGLPTAPR